MFQDFLKKLLQEMIEEQEKKEPSNTPIAIPNIGSSYTLEVEGVEVSLNDEPPGLALFSKVCTLTSQANMEPLFKTLLRGNFMGQATRKASLGLNEDGTAVLLSHRLPTIKNYREFRDSVEDFINTACFWKAKVDELRVKSGT